MGLSLLALTTSLVYLASLLSIEAYMAETLICPISDEEFSELYNVPSKPLNVDVLLFNEDGALLKWEEPDDDGGFDILSYQIEFKTVLEEIWRTGSRVPAEGGRVELPADGPVIFTALQAGLMATLPFIPYEFRVVAINENGFGEPSKSVSVEPPSAPRNLYIKDINKEESYAVLEWDRPLDDGGKDILFYIVEHKSPEHNAWNVTYIVPANETTAKIENITFDSASFHDNLFEFRVQAWNIAGLSKYSNIAFARPPPTPKNLRILLLSDEFAKLEWEIEDEGQVSPKVVVRYAVHYRERGADKWVTKLIEHVNKDGDKRVGTLPLNTTDKNYEYSVTALTAAGASMPTDPVYLEKADPPLNLTVVEIKDDHVDLKWEKPTRDGGSKITAYIVEYRNRNISGIWKEYKSEGNNFLHMSGRIRNLNREANYEFRVRAFTNAGKSRPSNIAYIDKPSAPRNVSIKQINFKNGTVTLEWLQPESDGQREILEYVVEGRPAVDSGAWETPRRMRRLPVNGVRAVLEGLDTVNSSYQFRVAAVNVAGRGPYSHIAYLGKPSEPTNFSVVSMNEDRGSATLQWQTPSSDGGSPITGYVVEYRETTPGSDWEREEVYATSPTENTVSAKIRNLERGKTYEFRAVAINMAGYGLPSNSDSIRKPSAPKDLELYDLDWDTGAVTLRWTKPDVDGGRDITGYVLEYRKKRSTSIWIEETTQSTEEQVIQVVKGIDYKKGDVYEYRVRAMNAAGRGAYSELVSIESPGPTLGLRATDMSVEEDYIALEWQPPKSNGGGDIKLYVIERRDKEGGEWSFGGRADGGSLRAELRALNLSRVSYEFRVRAGNMAGLGPPGDVTSLGKPPPPQNVEIVYLDPQHGTADLSWRHPAADALISQYVIEYRVKGDQTWTVGELIDGHYDEGTQPGLDLKQFVYEFVVKSIGMAGRSEPSEIVRVDKPSTPAKPYIMDMMYDDINKGSVLLTWEKSVIPGPGDSTNKGYIIEYKDISERDWDPNVVRVEGENVLIAKVSGLNLDQITYVFRVKAFNMAGYSNVSVEEYVERPHPPRDLDIINMHEDRAELVWRKPSHEGKRPIIDYLIEYSVRNTDVWSAGVRVNELKAIQPGLDVESSVYLFRVRARNIAGYSNFSNIACVEKPLRPEKVEIRKMTGSDTENGTATVTWHRPNNPSRKSPILGYIIEYKDINDDSGLWSKQKVEKNIISETLYGLNLKDKTYAFRIKAYNMAGPGDASEQIVIYKPPPPNGFTIVNMSETENCVELKWSPPEETHDYNIIHYIIEYSVYNNGNETWQQAEQYEKQTTTHLCSRYFNLTFFTYKFRVRAVNIAGFGDPSNEDFVDKPEIPLDLEISNINANLKYIELTWQEPSNDGGRNITGYLIEYRARNHHSDWLSKKVNAETLKTKIDGLNLTNFTYEFRVKAINMAGKSNYSNVAFVDWPQPPDDFQVTKLNVDDGSAELDWSPPADDGGKEVIGYRVEYRKRGTTQWDFEQFGTTVKGSIHALNLAEHAYEFRIRANNIAGYGNASKIDFIEKPGAPIDVTVSNIMSHSGMSTAAITWRNPAIIDDRSEITGHVIETYDKGSEKWSNRTSIHGSKAYALLDNLDLNNTSYLIRVRAVNMAGLGEPSKNISIYLNKYIQ